MSISLYEHQRKAIEKLRTGSILVGGVGTGKSRTALAYYYVKVCGGTLENEFQILSHAKDLYIITTARKRDTCEWESECAPFLLSTNKDLSMCGIKVVIDSWNNIEKYVDVESAFVIFDEQRVVGSGTWAKSFIKIAKKNDWILLSATPGDTWSDYGPVFVANGFYKNITEFRRCHIVYSRFTKYPKIDRYINVDRLEQLRSRIVVNMRYLKKTSQHYEYIKTDYDKEVFSRLKDDRWNVFENRPIKDISELCYAMRKVVNSSEDRLNKVKDLVINNDRTILFYNFDYELELLRHIFKSLPIVVAEWNGHKHEPIPKTKKWCYLVQYTAGAEGWNCIETNVVIFYSQHYSYKIMKQAAGRIDRLNTSYFDLYYYNLISDSFIDNAIRNSLRKKKNFNEKTLLI